MRRPSIAAFLTAVEWLLVYDGEGADPEDCPNYRQIREVADWLRADAQSRADAAAIKRVQRALPSEESSRIPALFRGIRADHPHLLADDIAHLIVDGFTGVKHGHP